MNSVIITKGNSQKWYLSEYKSDDNCTFTLSRGEAMAMDWETAESLREGKCWRYEDEEDASVYLVSKNPLSNDGFTTISDIATIKRLASLGHIVYFFDGYDFFYCGDSLEVSGVEVPKFRQDALRELV